VALFADALRRDQVVNAKLLSSSGFTFGVPPGNYVPFAFEDQNKDLQYQPGEPAGVVGVESPIVVVAGKTVTDVAVDLNPEFRPPASGETATNYPKLWAGRKNVGSIANDGVVTVTSQLEPAAKANASGIYGFDAGHTDILRDQRTS
jgi:hypothetical protein